MAGMFEKFREWSKQELIRLIHKYLDIHVSQHEDGGADELSLAGLSGVPSDAVSTYGNIGNIDGGKLGGSVDLLLPAIISDAYDAMTGAMDSLFVNLDGGTL